MAGRAQTALWRLRAGRVHSSKPPEALGVRFPRGRVVLVAEHRHPDGVVVAAVAVELLPQTSLDLKPRLFVGAHRPRVARGHSAPDLVEVEAIEAIESELLGHLGTIALVPELLCTEQDAEFGLPGGRVDVVEPGESDRLAGQPGLAQEDRVAGIVALPAGLVRQ